MLIPASLRSPKFYNQQLDCPIDFSELALLFNEDSLSDLFKADFKRWEHNLRDKWRARGQTIRHTEDYSYWWPEGLSASFGLTDEQLCMMLFVAEQHRDSMNQMAQYMGALEWLKCNALSWVSFKPLKINSRSKQGQLTGLALKELGLGKADFDLFTSKFIYVKSVAHLDELLATGPVQKEDFQQLKLAETLAVEFTKEPPIGIDDQEWDHLWYKPATESNLLGMLKGLIISSSFNWDTHTVDKSFAKYVGLNDAVGKLPVKLSSYKASVEYLEDNGYYTQAVRACLYLLLEVGILSMAKKQATLFVGNTSYSAIVNPYQNFVDILEKFAGKTQPSFAVCESIVEVETVNFSEASLARYLAPESKAKRHMKQLAEIVQAKRLADNS